MTVRAGLVAFSTKCSSQIFAMIESVAEPGVAQYAPHSMIFAAWIDSAMSAPRAIGSAA